MFSVLIVRYLTQVSPHAFNSSLIVCLSDNPLFFHVARAKILSGIRFKLLVQRGTTL